LQWTSSLRVFVNATGRDTRRARVKRRGRINVYIIMRNRVEKIYIINLRLKVMGPGTVADLEGSVEADSGDDANGNP
jgi:hypothetical protein